MRKDDSLEMANQWLEMSKVVQKYIKQFAKLLARINSTKAITMGKRNKFKFVVQFPDNFEHSHLLDMKIGNSLWADAIAKEPAKIIEFTIFHTA